MGHPAGRFSWQKALAGQPFNRAGLASLQFPLDQVQDAAALAALEVFPGSSLKIDLQRTFSGRPR